METEKVKNKYELVTKTDSKWTWYRKLVARLKSGLVGEITIQVPFTDEQVAWLQNNDERFKDAISPKRMALIIASALEMPKELYTEVQSKKESDLISGYKRSLTDAINKQITKENHLEVKSKFIKHLENLKYSESITHNEFMALADKLDELVKPYLATTTEKAKSEVSFENL